MYAGVAMGMLSLLERHTSQAPLPEKDGYAPSKFMPAFMQPIQIKPRAHRLIFSCDQANEKQGKVRNFLRSGVQEVAHLAGGHELRGL
jgi:hypothetical protein